MLQRHLSVLIFGYLALHTLIAAELIALPGRSTDLAPKEISSQRKRQPATIQEQGNINAVSTPGQQTQNATSTAGKGNGTNPDPGVITNPGATPISEEVNCTDPTTGRDNKCWEELKLTQWVEDWVDTNACYKDEAFASCFLRKEGFPGLDCTGIKIDACTSPQGDNVLTKPEVFYVAYNIYGVNQFFLSWWTAVGDAAGIASDNIGQIVQMLDPLSKANTILDDVLISLTGVFALVPGLGYMVDGIEGFTEGWTAFAQIIENALFVIPQIGRWIFPIDSATSQVIQMASLSTQMGGIIQTVQNNLNKTLVDVMQNTTMFLAFASQGNFSASAPSLPDQTNYLLYAFNTYIISQALTGNNIYGVIGLHSNPQALSFNGTTINHAYDFHSTCQGYNEQNICDAWWYSGRYSSAFSLDDFAHPDRNYGDILGTLFTNYTTGELLFDGAYACNANGNYGQPVNVTVNSAGVNTGCLSQLRILTWDMSCDDPLHRTSVGCEFLEAPRQNGFFGNCNSHSAYSVMDDPVYCVPYSYLGPLVTTNDYKLKRGG